MLHQLRSPDGLLTIDGVTCIQVLYAFSETAFVKKNQKEGLIVKISFLGLFYPLQDSCQLP